MSSIRELVRRALTGHDIRSWIRNPVTDQLEEIVKPQRQGQLMGSIVSFPFLCIINCAVCLWSMTIDNPWIARLPLSEVPLLVNGDDCVFGGNERLLEIWKQCIRYVGFSSSVGKTYFQRDLLVMNSMTFFLELEGWKYQPYTNHGLLKAVGKDGESQNNPFSFSSIQNELRKRTESGKWDAVNKMFFRNHTPTFKKLALPYYMPIWAGGLGLIVPENHCTYVDRKRLSQRMKNKEHFKSPPIDEDWWVERVLKRVIGSFYEPAVTNSRTLVTRMRHVNLDEKEFYAPILSQSLLTYKLKEFEARGDFENEIASYVQKMKKRWLISKFDEDLRVASMEKIFTPLEKRYLALLVSGRV